MSKPLVWLVALAALLQSASALEDQGVYLHIIEVEVVDSGGDPSIRLFVDGSAALAGSLRERGLDVVASDDESLTMSLGKARQTFGGDAGAWQADTFIVDFSEQPVVDMLASDAWQSDEPVLSVEAMESRVFEWIDDKTYARNFDFASTVARTRSGDCTEHAVLLAAAARAAGKPARVVLGLMLIDGESPRVFGHAWTEVWESGQWQLLDATLPEKSVDPESIYYIPTGLVENESPSYSMSLLSQLMQFPDRVELAR